MSTEDALLKIADNNYGFTPSNLTGNAVATIEKIVSTINGFSWHQMKTGDQQYVNIVKDDIKVASIPFESDISCMHAHGHHVIIACEDKSLKFYNCESSNPEAFEMPTRLWETPSVVN